MKTVLVIGGGITGISAMYDLQKWKKNNHSDVRLILTEGSSELGGKISTVHKDGFLMEAGADSLVSRKASMMSSIEELGLEEEIVYNATGRSLIFADGELKPVPADAVFGIPASVESLATTTLVSAQGKVEALKDLYTKNETFTKSDSIGEFLEYFLGKELVEKQISPILSGVYSGNLHDLTISSTIPFVFDYKEEFGSIIKGLEANKAKFQSRSGAKFFSFKSGLDTLINGYVKKMEDVEILKEYKAVKLEKSQGRYLVTYENGEIIEADQVILSIPHDAAERLFENTALEKEFAQFTNSSLISVYAGFDIPDDVLPTEATGFVTATFELSCNACTWTSRKWEHTSKQGNLLIRMFYKSSHPRFDEINGKSKEELLQVALADIEKSLGIKAEPSVSEVTDWSEMMPNYSITHPQSVEDVERSLAEEYPGIYISGCSYYGVGIPDCIENGANTAKKVIQKL
ncbi:protoporphyrinogen oxidase [Bacillus dakarensis]|uniref:protoporphyrinogen oxidase n=1 Tax=Robertmurraya dakarensis TaxID=1926278 RepID=UPI000980B334|nr:protoporphyrinogen oxidase [Bacillus dakarensis]